MMAWPTVGERGYGSRLSPFGARDEKQALFPIQVFQPQGPCFAGAQGVNGQQKQNSAIPNILGSGSLSGGDKAPHRSRMDPRVGFRADTPVAMRLMPRVLVCTNICSRHIWRKELWSRKNHFKKSSTYQCLVSMVPSESPFS